MRREIMDEPPKPGAPPPARPEPGAEPTPVTNSRKPSFGRRGPVIVAGTVAAALLLFVALNYFIRSLTHESTDNAFLDGDVVSVAPQVTGHVKAVHVVNHQAVKAGDLLVEIDLNDYNVLLEQKKSALAAAASNVKVIQASFQLLAAQVVTADAIGKQTAAEAVASQAAADKANADLKRAEDLFHRNITSPQEYDAAKAAANAANANLNAAQEKAASERSKVDAAKAQLEAGRAALSRAEAQSDESRVDVEQAELNLSYTRITAPRDGHIARK